MWKKLKRQILIRFPRSKALCTRPADREEIWVSGLVGAIGSVFARDVERCGAEPEVSLAIQGGAWDVEGGASEGLVQAISCALGADLFLAEIVPCGSAEGVSRVAQWERCRVEGQALAPLRATLEDWEQCFVVTGAPLQALQFPGVFQLAMVGGIRL